MPRTVATESGLEIHLMRKSVDAAWAERPRCADCRRTPLVGERTYSFADAQTVCELCRALRPGESSSSRLVHGPEHNHTVRIRARTP